MPEMTETGYLSIGEVLGLLLEEFPDVTISKIRFLESQGLISPERTPSGYRKFYDDDVDLLRVILTEQRENYLPLRVIKDRLETGEIDPTGEHLRPNESAAEHEHDGEQTEVPRASIAAHPAARHHPAPDASPTSPSTTPASTSATDTTMGTATGTTTGTTTEPSPNGRSGTTTASPDAAAQLLPGVLLDRAELCSMVGMTDDELVQLESFGIVAARDSGGVATYGDDAVQIAKPACEFLRAGIDARHLRNWRTSAEREASLFEQVVTPKFRQRNPEAHAEALAQLRHLDALGAKLRAAMTRQALRHHFES